MPLNTLRLNHLPSSHPNDRITFIKPLPRPPTHSADEQTASLLLRAIAAQCLPIMKTHYLSVTTLEEHEPNSEFIGRNFNNGEIIQLVLRSNSGAWLPVNMIQMVMMHELAHNVQMNHSRAFWKTRNMFADEMRGLWARGYTGEGLWGGGRTLSELGGVMGRTVPSEELKDLPLCGGTFRSRTRKRRVKGQNGEGLSWKEKRDRRIEKKFGKNGVALGEDGKRRLSLELSGKGPIGVKPRVAQSKRGRELRVAAALARFGSNKKEVEELEAVKKEESGSEEDYEDGDVGVEDARDRFGRRLLDGKGRGMVKVCEEEDGDDVDVKREMEELENLDFVLASEDSTTDSPKENKPATKNSRTSRSLYDIPQHQDNPASAKQPLRDEPSPNASLKPKITIHKSRPLSSTPASTPPLTQPNPQPTPTDPISNPTPASSSPPTTSSPPPISQSTLPSNSTSVTTQKTTTCPICSLTNPSLQATCTACSHVLDRRKDPRSWKCTAEMCAGSEHVNSGDVGRCGVCGRRKEG